MQPASFAESEGGIVLAATGATAAQRWDGYAAAPSAAGVPAPLTAPAVEYYGDAVTWLETYDVTEEPVAEAYFAFVRFVDRWGNVSDPSPFSAAAERAFSSTVIDGQTVWTAQPFVRYTSLPTTSDPRVVRRQVLRNTTGQAYVFYVDIDTTDLTSSELTSTRGDTAQGEQEYPTPWPWTGTPLNQRPAQVILAADRSSLVARFAEPPDYLTVAASHLGRLWLAGPYSYSDGHAAVTNGSDTVYGYGGQWPAEWEGRYFTAAGGARTYLITGVTAATNESPAALTLDTAYEGATNARAAYAIRPDPAAGLVLQFSEAGLPEAWPAVNAFSVPAAGGPVTALAPFDSFLYVAQRAALQRISADTDPRKDGAVYDAARRGCAGPRCWVEANGLLYLMDERGLYSFDGRTVTPVSAAIQDLFLGKNRDGLTINWRSARHFHAVHAEAEQTVRFFVAINGDGLPRWAVCHNYQADKVWLERYPWRVGASAAADRTVLLAGQGGRVWVQAAAHDGAPAWQPAHAGDATAATALTVTLPGDPGDVVGLPLTVARGRAAGQTRIVVARSGCVLTVDRPFFPAPAAGDAVAVGAIPWTLRTHRLELQESEDREEFRLVVGYEPQAWGHLAVRRYSDHAAAADELAANLTPEDGDGVTGVKGDTAVEVQMSHRGGYAVLHGDRHLEPNTAGLRSVRVEVAGVSGPTRHALNSLRVRGTS